DELLGIVARAFGRHDKTVGDHIIDPIRSHRAGVAEVIDLDPCGPACEDGRTVAACEAFEINCDVDAGVSNQLGSALIGGVAHIDKLIEGRFEPAPQGAVVACPCESEYLKPSAIVMFKEAGCEQRHRVLAKIPRDISNSDLVSTCFWRELVETRS